jgi:hypothetical protein
MNNKLTLKFGSKTETSIDVEVDVDDGGLILGISCEEELKNILNLENNKIHLQRLVDSAWVGNTKLGSITISYSTRMVEYLVTKGPTQQ